MLTLLLDGTNKYNGSTFLVELFHVDIMYSIQVLCLINLGI